MKTVLFLLMVLRPLIDLTWDIAPLGFNAGAIIGVFLAIVMTCLFLARSRDLLPFKSVFFFLAVVFISECLFNESLGVFATFLRLLSPMVYLYYFWKEEQDLKKMELFMSLFILVSVVPLVISYLQYFKVLPFTYWDWMPESGMVGRSSGGYRHPTSLNRILMFTIPFALYFLNTNRKKLLHVIYIIAALFAVYTTYHRTTYLMLPLIFVFWYFDVLKTRGNGQGRRKIALLVLSLISIYLVTVALQYLPVKLTELFSSDTVLRMHGRDIRFNRIFFLFQNEPFLNKLLGHGSNQLYEGRPMVFIDNDFLNVFWRHGILGVFSWLLMIWSLVLTTFQLGPVKDQKDYLFNKLTRLIIFVYIGFGLIVEATFLPNVMYVVYSVVAMNYVNIKNRYSENELRKIPPYMNAAVVMLIGVLTMTLTIYALNFDANRANALVTSF